MIIGKMIGDKLEINEKQKWLSKNYQAFLIQMWSIVLLSPDEEKPWFLLWNSFVDLEEATKEFNWLTTDSEDEVDYYQNSYCFPHLCKTGLSRLDTFMKFRKKFTIILKSFLTMSMCYC